MQQPPKPTPVAATAPVRKQTMRLVVLADGNNRLRQVKKTIEFGKRGSMYYVNPNTGKRVWLNASKRDRCRAGTLENVQPGSCPPTAATPVPLQTRKKQVEASRPPVPQA